MVVNTDGHRPNRPSSWGARYPFASPISASGFLVLLLLMGTPKMAHSASRAGLKGPPARGPAVSNRTSNTADNSAAQQLLLSGILFFQRWLSPIDGPRCNFTPTCSNFGFQAVQSQGVLFGIVLTADRLMRCHYSVESDAGYLRLPRGSLYDPVSENLPPRHDDI